MKIFKQPPNIFSLEFHLEFFPALLWSRLFQKKDEEGGTRFTSTFDQMILLVFCLLIAAFGFPLAVHGSVVGWILSILGIGGVLVSMILSVIAQFGTKPSYDDFLFGVFFFFVFLGLTAGIFIGKTAYPPNWWVLTGALGLIIGYLAGILAGLWFQYLGWIAGIINMLLGCAVIGIIVVDAVLLLGK